MNINLIVRRSVVYTIILGINNYYLRCNIFTDNSFLSVILIKTIPLISVTALAVVALLQPVKIKENQKFVDKKFFRIEYDYREEQKRFLDDIKNIF